jgi:hypothetical protein
MHAAILADDAGIVVIERIQLRLLGNGPDHGTHEEGQQRQLRPFRSNAARRFLLVEAGAQFFQRRDVNLFHIGDVGDARFGKLHLFGDLAPQPDDLDLVDLVVAREARHLAGLRPARDEGVEIVMADASGRAAARHLPEIDAGFPGAQTHGRRSQRLLAFFARRAGGAAHARRPCRCDSSFLPALHDSGRRRFLHGGSRHAGLRRRFRCGLRLHRGIALATIALGDITLPDIAFAGHLEPHDG